MGLGQFSHGALLGNGEQWPNALLHRHGADVRPKCRNCCGNETSCAKFELDQLLVCRAGGVAGIRAKLEATAITFASGWHNTFSSREKLHYKIKQKAINDAESQTHCAGRGRCRSADSDWLRFPTCSLAALSPAGVLRPTLPCWRAESSSRNRQGQRRQKSGEASSEPSLGLVAFGDSGISAASCKLAVWPESPSRGSSRTPPPLFGLCIETTTIVVTVNNLPDKPNSDAKRHALVFAARRFSPAPTRCKVSVSPPIVVSVHLTLLSLDLNQPDLDSAASGRKKTVKQFC